MSEASVNATGCVIRLTLSIHYYNNQITVVCVFVMPPYFYLPLFSLCNKCCLYFVSLLLMSEEDTKTRAV